LAFRSVHIETALKGKLECTDVSSAFEGAVYSFLLWLVFLASITLFLFSKTTSLAICYPDQLFTFICRFVSAFLMHL
jgi:hypothetical protein